jgi:hypothetical protein
MERTMTPITYVNSRRDRMRRILAEGGQTPTEYLMIVGIMAAVILIAFVVFFWDDVQVAAKNWSGNAAAAVDSSNNASGNTVTEGGAGKK